MRADEERQRPTRAQIDYARELIDELKNDPDWYDVEHMTRSELARLIDKMRFERGGGTMGEMLPTAVQIDYAEDLLAKLGYDKDNVFEMCGKDFDLLTRQEMSELISDLREEWEGL